MLTVKINGKELQLKSSITLEEYIVSKAMQNKAIIVEYNYEIPEKEAWPSIELKEGDNIEILKFIGGG